eukprot:CAMPEP_0175231554 /NCGR_PEP_ID=MMETSP0093-20121207/25516_1 /TAXON_ID=311494 /ORGANISM="Alexandrium monilatum, Strain CCMP3105" /LENGTH=68 /DNA_ID=CAMNT_0016525409 /DNA_START=35 /DNA_END=237 /DNA_ORIENTATION=-
MRAMHDGASVLRSSGAGRVACLQDALSARAHADSRTGASLESGRDAELRKRCAGPSPGSEPGHLQTQT